MGEPGATGSPGASELTLRVLSSVVMAAVALLSAWIGGWLVAVLWLGAAIAVATEWAAMTRIEPRGRVTLALGIGLVAIQFTFAMASGIALAAVPLVALAAVLVAAETPRDRLWAGLGLAYAAPIAVVPLLLRFHPASPLAPLLWMFAIVWTTDVAAYFVGRTFGGPKLWPSVSPKKTWSGFAGGLTGAALAGVAVAVLATPAGAVHLRDGIVIGVLSAVASVASQAGDLVESAMKRHFGVKDSGHLIPGHGGFMDRLDGFAAVAILLAVLMPLATLSWWWVAP